MEAEDLSQTKQNFAGFWVRYAAFILDGLILMIPCFALMFGFASLSSRSFDASNFEHPEFPLNLALVLIVWGYNIFFVANYGATPGKRIFKIKVLRTDQTAVSLGKAILRETVGKILSGMFFGLGYIWAGFDNSKQSWHDKIAGTYVIYTEGLNRGRKIFASLVAFLLPGLAILGIVAGLLLVAVSPTGQMGQAKDAIRRSDTINIARALELYYTENGVYPDNLSELSGKLPYIPRDPDTNTEYTYRSVTGGEDYILRATLSTGEVFEVSGKIPPRTVSQ
jgi:uncharacterized RDD family membrane protein YckC